MSLIGYHCRKGMVPHIRYWYTLNYDNGYRADSAIYDGDLSQLSRRANELSLERGRAVHIRKCWEQGNDVHYMTVSIHAGGRKVR